jgi:hypothetical protein
LLTAATKKERKKEREKEKKKGSVHAPSADGSVDVLKKLTRNFQSS